MTSKEFFNTDNIKSGDNILESLGLTKEHADELAGTFAHAVTSYESKAEQFKYIVENSTSSALLLLLSRGFAEACDPVLEHLAKLGREARFDHPNEN